MSSAKEDTSGRLWHALDVVVESQAREAVEYALMEAGALGTETTHLETFRVTGYFDRTPDRERVRSELAEALRIYELPSSSVREMNLREVANEDWLGEWKKNWQPVESGRFIIAPPWSEIDFPNDRIVIRIEPGMAFGTGTHETTRLCLAAIEKYFEVRSFLDVGTGTGILAIAAAKLSPAARITACDTDAEALEIARENARLNGTGDRIEFQIGSIDDSTVSADFVCANLTADVIGPLMPSLLNVSCGRLVLSGILDTQVDDVLARLRECGVSNPIEIMRDGEWAALVI
ncbi:MAG TPA: 50S ribosomal protein L11 methyltransferase [Pyrinomonadaceae bacterium]|nr:50S ribosomal protein L11 methyltransferase [Pyrinomonadaceae bacterium]